MICINGKQSVGSLGPEPAETLATRRKRLTAQIFDDVVPIVKAFNAFDAVGSSSKVAAGANVTFVSTDAFLADTCAVSLVAGPVDGTFAVTLTS